MEEASKAPEIEDPSASPQQHARSRPPGHTTSKYDFVKVRVWLGENSDHYYVLSRFLLSRMLTVTKIPHHVAIKISLELKKLLVDNSLLDVSQTDLEANIFKLMERRGFGSEYISRYKMMTRFHHQRTYLSAEQPVLTDMVYELLRSSTDAPLTSTPIWEREFGSPEELITEFCRECRIVRKGLDGDLTKAMKDGKPVIIEGIHLDPSSYLGEEKGMGNTNKDVALKETNDDQNQPSTEPDECTRKPKAIIVPIVLRMADIDHQMLLEEWIASRSVSITEEEEAALVVKLRTIQEYLCSFESQGVWVVPIPATSFPQTLDSLHGYLLQRIEMGCRTS